MTTNQTIDHIKVGDLTPVQIGNENDLGCFRGEVVVCNILEVKKNRFSTSFLAEPVNDPGVLVDARHVPILYEEGITKCVLYATDARIINNDTGWTRERCIESLSYSI